VAETHGEMLDCRSITFTDFFLNKPIREALQIQLDCTTVFDDPLDKVFDRDARMSATRAAEALAKLPYPGPPIGGVNLMWATVEGVLCTLPNGRLINPSNRGACHPGCAGCRGNLVYCLFASTQRNGAPPSPHSDIIN
jgi:hypothetical protein